MGVGVGWGGLCSRRPSPRRANAGSRAWHGCCLSLVAGDIAAGQMAQAGMELMQRAIRTGRPAPLSPCGRRKETRAYYPRPHRAKEREIKCHYHVVPWPVHRIFMVLGKLHAGDRAVSCHPRPRSVSGLVHGLRGGVSRPRLHCSSASSFGREGKTTWRLMGLPEWALFLFLSPTDAHTPPKALG